MARGRDKPKAKPGTYITRGMFESKAYASLKGAAPQILVLLLGQRYFTRVRKGKKNDYQLDSDTVSLPYYELRRLGYTQPRITRAIDELLAKGFITVVHLGGRHKTDLSVYRLIDSQSDGNTTRTPWSGDNEPHKSWQYWTPGTVFEKRQRDVHRGWQGGCKLAVE